MTNESLIAIIVLLIGSHYASLIYRLHRVEQKYESLQKEVVDRALAVANAAVIAAQSAAAALKAK